MTDIDDLIRRGLAEASALAPKHGLDATDPNVVAEIAGAWVKGYQEGYQSEVDKGAAQVRDELGKVLLEPNFGRFGHIAITAWEFRYDVRDAIGVLRGLGEHQGPVDQTLVALMLEQGMAAEAVGLALRATGTQH